MPQYHSTDQFLEWCPVPGTPVWGRMGFEEGGSSFPSGDSGRVLEKGVGVDASTLPQSEFVQGLALPGGEYTGRYCGPISTTYLLAHCSRVQTAGYPHTALPIFGVQGGINVANGWSQQLGVVCRTLRLSCGAPGDPIDMSLSWLAYNHALQAGTASPVTTGITNGWRSTKGGAVTIGIDGAAAAAYKCQSITANLNNNPIPGTSLDTYDDAAAGAELWIPPGYDPGEEAVGCDVSLRYPIHYNAFGGSSWSYLTVTWDFTDGTTLQRLVLGPIYRDDGGIKFVTEGQYIQSISLEAKPDTKAWTFTPVVA